MKCLIFLLVTSFSAHGASIALDIGHSRSRPGVTAASGKTEWELNRQLGLDVSRDLSQLGISYQLIGAGGDMNDLYTRTALAKSDKFFISLHHDSMQPELLNHAEQFRGFALFVSRLNLHLDASLHCAQKIGERLLAQGYRPSGYHAARIAGENRPFADPRRGVHFYDGLAVLRTARQPAVLIEAGVAVNPDDERRVASSSGRQKIAQAIASGIADCLRPQ